MKLLPKIRWILYVIVGLMLITAAILFIYLRSIAPVYSGTMTLAGLEKQVEIRFDDFGIPHISASGEQDAYFALGFVHAQERLFQMELLRRVGSGRLAEVFGKDLTIIDAFFRILGISETADKGNSLYMKSDSLPYQKAALAYLRGINSYIRNGQTPIEFTLLGIPKTEFSSRDLFLISGYMAFSFAEALKNDPVLTQIKNKYGIKYLNDLVPGLDSTRIASCAASGVNFPAEILASFLDLNIVSPFIGSNAWAVAPSQTAKGKVLFCNDTHIGYGQPSVWYEAHLRYPGYDFYGNFLAGFPFALVGHTRAYAWGLTMLENDDLDLYIEKQNPDNAKQYFHKGEWKQYKTRTEVIHVKNEKDSVIEIKETIHGPLLHTVVENIERAVTDPVSIWWTFVRENPTVLQNSYIFNHAGGMNDFRSACSNISAPGLNVIYGDSSGNIAWWSCAKLIQRPAHVNPKFMLDGTGADDPLGYFDFSKNPQEENPLRGFVYSANNFPDTITSFAIPGYYAPRDRTDRIRKFLEQDKLFSARDMQVLQADNVSDVHAGIAAYIVSVLKTDPNNSQTEMQRLLLEKLSTWDGSHQLLSTEPVIYYKLFTSILELAMLDETGEDDFYGFEVSHTMKNAYLKLITNPRSPWWDNVKTKNHIESQEDIFNAAWKKSIEELTEQLGPNVKYWSWSRVHFTVHPHALGKQKPFDRIFDVGPLPSPGGRETVNNASFPFSKNGIYKASYGPAMRIVVDFADTEHAQSILPTGQSGNVMSPHYKDQARLYVDCKYRLMMMDEKEINSCKRLLTLNPE